MSRVKDIAKKNALRLKRKRRIRGKISGTAEKPRVSVYKSNKYFYAQAIDDVAGNTLASINSKALNLSVNKENVVNKSKENHLDAVVSGYRHGAEAWTWAYIYPVSQLCCIWLWYAPNQNFLQWVWPCWIEWNQ